MRRRPRRHVSEIPATRVANVATMGFNSMSAQDASAGKRRWDLMGSTMNPASGLQQQAALGTAGARGPGLAWQVDREQGPSSSTVAAASPSAPTAPWRFLVTITPPLVLLWGNELHCPLQSRRSVCRRILGKEHDLGRQPVRSGRCVTPLPTRSRGQRHVASNHEAGSTDRPQCCRLRGLYASDYTSIAAHIL